MARMSAPAVSGAGWLAFAAAFFAFFAFAGAGAGGTAGVGGAGAWPFSMARMSAPAVSGAGGGGGRTAPFAAAGFWSGATSPPSKNGTKSRPYPGMGWPPPWLNASLDADTRASTIRSPSPRKDLVIVAAGGCRRRDFRAEPAAFSFSREPFGLARPSTRLSRESVPRTPRPTRAIRLLRTFDHAHTNFGRRARQTASLVVPDAKEARGIHRENELTSRWIFTV